MTGGSTFRFGEDRGDGPVVRFDHPAPALHDVTDTAGRVSIFDPDRIEDGQDHWLQIDGEHVISASEAV